MDVLILAAEDSTKRTYGVIPVDMNSTFEKIQAALLTKKSELPAVEKLEVNLICAEQSNVLARVQILSIDPLYLSYVDFGYEEIKDSYCNLRRIPNSLAQIDPVAFKMTVKNHDIELREGQTVSVKILEKILEGHYFVDVNDLDLLSDSLSPYESASEANTVFFEVNSPPLSTQKTDLVIPPSSSKNDVENEDLRSEIGSVATVDLAEEFVTKHPALPTKYHINEIPVNTSFALIVMNNLNDSRCTGMIIETTSRLLQFMKKYLKNLKPDSAYRPEVGDSIVALLPDSDVWSRAIVLSVPTALKTKYRVAMIDIGCVHEVEEIAPLNDYYRDLSNLSVYCEIKRFPANRKPLKLFKTYNKCEITEKLDDGTIIGCIKAKINQEYEVCFKPWTPTIDELGVSKMPVSNNSRVKISAYNTSNTCHVNLWDCENERIGRLLVADVEDFCVDAEPMTEEPFISEIVGVEDEKDVFWRGQVLEKLGNTYSIYLLDRGIKCTSRLEQLRSLAFTPSSSTLNQHLKTSFAFAVPVTLKNVPVTDIPANVSSFMQDLIEKEDQFDVLIDETTGEVELKFLADESYADDINNETTLNEYLANLLTPTWKKLLKNPTLAFDEYLENVLYFMSDLRYDELAIGSKMSLHVAAVSKEDICVVNKNGKNYAKLFEVNLFERLAEYANSNTASYVPNVQELCIAEHENVWYRAVCLYAEPNAGIIVQLIDDGRIEHVSHKKVRRMISEFYHYAAVALICRPKDKTHFDERKTAELVNNTIRARILGVEVEHEQNVYIVDCRKIFAKL